MLGTRRPYFYLWLGIGILATPLMTAVAAFGQAAGSASGDRPLSDQSAGGATPSGPQASGQSLAGQSLAGQSLAGQSLADVARANRDKKAADTSAPALKVITNADLPKNPDGYSGPPPEEEERAVPRPSNAAREAAQQRAAARAGTAWRQQIMAQTNRIAMLQTRVDRLRAQIHVVDPNANYDDAAGTSYNGAQATQIRILKDMEEELRQQQQRLQEMQDNARRAGMHTAVYDP